MANSTRSFDPGRTATLVSYWLGANTCSNSADSCTSPQTPRVLTLVNTFFRSPTPTARFCISPRPLYTCSRRSETVRNDSPRRLSSVALSFSSTVCRICSSFFSFSPCRCIRLSPSVWRISASRRSLTASFSSSVWETRDIWRSYSCSFSSMLTRMRSMRSSSVRLIARICPPKESSCCCWVRDISPMMRTTESLMPRRLPAISSRSAARSALVVVFNSLSPLPKSVSMDANRSSMACFCRENRTYSGMMSASSTTTTTASIA